MLKKRVIYTLLYNEGSFMLSRNFRLQKVGDINWLKKNYNFSTISFFIDELIILNVSKNLENKKDFLTTLKLLSEECFVPIAAGGGVRTLDDAKELMNSGADKIVLNTAIFLDLNLVKEISTNYGQQCVVASIDIKLISENEYKAVIESGTRILNETLEEIFTKLSNNLIGECYLNSIDKDGTGQGFDLRILNQIPKNFNIPIIFAGGAGNALHLINALRHPKIDAVATANLFNFVGNGLQLARKSIISNNIELAVWPEPNFKKN